MAEINKCFKLHFDLSSIDNFNAFLDTIIKISDFTFDNNGDIFIWLDDDKEKKDIISAFKKNKIKEYFCEPIYYETIGKDSDFNFISSWFVEKYTAYVHRCAEKENQDQLRKMYENIKLAQALLEEKQKQLKK